MYWFYKTSTCNGTPPVLNNMPNSADAIYLAGKNAYEDNLTDFTLLEILGKVPTNITWADWTTKEPSVGDAVVGIHHPNEPPDDYRRISFGDIVGTLNNKFWDVDWNSGTVEEGSSGSCIWNSNHQCIGQLWALETKDPCDPTFKSEYGKFSVSYPFMQSFLQKGSDDSLEDNDTRATAKTIAAGSYKSNVVKLNDEDWYKISVPQNTRIAADISFINNNGNINMKLYRGSDTAPVSSSIGTSDSEHVEYYNNTGLTDYFIHVFLADDTRNTYNLTIKFGSDSGDRWVKNYGFLGGTVNAIQMTSDTGYIAAGESNGNLWVFKLDSGGNIQWEKILDNGGQEFAVDIRQTSDGGYMVAGETDASDPGYPDIWILKLDSSGSIQWQKTYGFSNGDEAKSIQQTTDGGYIVAGFNASYGLWLLKIDANGNIQSQKRYGGGISDYETIIKTLDGGYIVAAYATGSGHQDFWILKLDSNLNIQWQKTYGSSIEQDVPHSIQQTTDGGYIVAGETYSFGGGSADFWVLKLDVNGGVQWQKSYGSSNGDLAYSIKQTLDGGYIVAGETYSFSTYDFDALVLKLDSNGNIEWQRAYGSSDDDGIYSIHQEADSGYIAAGYTYSFSTGNAWVQRLDSNGNIDSCSSVKTSNATAFNTSATIINTNATMVNTSVSPATSNASLVSPNSITNAICYAAATKQPEIFVYPSSLDFGYMNPNTLTSRRVVVRNTGKADLIVNTIAITGTNAGEFSQTNNCSTIPINSSCTIDVKFAPATDGVKSAILSIPSNDPGTPKLDIPLSGIGGIILVVTKGGTGNGTVTSAPSGINCGNYCIEAYGTGTSVTLTATPDTGSTFAGWSGACSGTGSCILTMNYDKTVTALFTNNKISGTVTNGVAKPMGGVTVTLSGTSSASLTTDTDGTYSFMELTDGPYTVTPSKTGYIFSPENINVIISGANVTGQNFTGNCNVSFTDVPTGHWAENYIKEMYCRGITTGCSTNPLMYCPSKDVTRQAMAAFIIRAMGETTSSVANNAYFDDIAGNTFAPYINRMYELGITTGCDTRLYCPGNPVTRLAMAAFIIRAMGETTSSAANNAYFDDIAGNTFAPYINRMYELGITTGCDTRLYCPGNPVTRLAMAVFIIRAF